MNFILGNAALMASQITSDWFNGSGMNFNSIMSDFNSFDSNGDQQLGAYEFINKMTQHLMSKGFSGSMAHNIAKEMFNQMNTEGTQGNNGSLNANEFTNGMMGLTSLLGGFGGGGNSLDDLFGGLDPDSLMDIASQFAGADGEFSKNELIAFLKQVLGLSPQQAQQLANALMGGGDSFGLDDLQSLLNQCGNGCGGGGIDFADLLNALCGGGSGGSGGCHRSGNTPLGNGGGCDESGNSSTTNSSTTNSSINCAFEKYDRGWDDPFNQLEGNERAEFMADAASAAGGDGEFSAAEWSSFAQNSMGMSADDAAASYDHFTDQLGRAPTVDDMQNLMDDYRNGNSMSKGEFRDMVHDLIDGTAQGTLDANTTTSNSSSGSSGGNSSSGSSSSNSGSGNSSSGNGTGNSSSSGSGTTGSSSSTSGGAPSGSGEQNGGNSDRGPNIE